MTLKGYCEICGRRAVARCKICGRLVCEEHYDKKRGICVICAQSLCEICGKRLAVGRCVFCKRLVCDKCSVQLDNVRRICVECLYKRFNGDLNLARRAIREKSYYKIPKGPRLVTIKILEDVKKGDRNE
jgi:hypothetical protein